MQFHLNLLRDEHAATAVEYGLIAALIALAAVTSLKTAGNQVGNTMTVITTKMASA